jgi:hypothetical protein
MRFTFLFGSALCLMLVSACNGDTKAPAGDMKAVADTKATPDLGTPDTQVKPEQKVATPDTMPHFDGTVPKCAYEVDLAGKEPCMCGSTLVYDLKVQYPDCTSPKVVKCCPTEGKPKCE